MANEPVSSVMRPTLTGSSQVTPAVVAGSSVAGSSATGSSVVGSSVAGSAAVGAGSWVGSAVGVPPPQATISMAMTMASDNRSSRLRRFISFLHSLGVLVAIQVCCRSTAWICAGGGMMAKGSLYRCLFLIYFVLLPGSQSLMYHLLVCPCFARKPSSSVLKISAFSQRAA